MIRNAIYTVLFALLASAPHPAQQRPGPSPLDQMHEAFQQERLKLVERGAGIDEQRKLAAGFADKLETFLGTAQGSDRFNGRLMLVDYRLVLGQRDKAKAALKGIDPNTSPALVLAAAAEFAGILQLDQDRKRYLDAALKAKAPFEERMALGMQLMTRLSEVEMGEQVFADARKAARDDEQRAKVGWFWAMAVREREDLPEDAHEKALEELAQALPDTYYGGVAKDRLRARALRPGAAAIDFSARTVGGESLTLKQLRGKVIALHFWSTWSGDCEAAAAHLKTLHGDLADRGLALVTVSMDEDPAFAQNVARQQGAVWPLICDGRGPQTDLALRYAVDGPARLVLIDKQGKVASLRAYPYDGSSAQELRAAIEAELKKQP